MPYKCYLRRQSNTALQRSGWIGAFLTSKRSKKALSIYQGDPFQPLAERQTVRWLRFAHVHRPHAPYDLLVSCKTAILAPGLVNTDAFIRGAGGTMVAQPTSAITEEAYLAFERTSTTKHEYYAGQIYAMTGAKEPHNLIAGNTHASLHQQLRQRPCRVYQSDMRVKVSRTSLNTYPDVVVICGQPQFTDTAHDAVVNPIVLIEVLSPSTERYDRGMKFEHYRTIESLRAYVLIAQDHQHIECYTRQDTGQWLLQEASAPNEYITLHPIACILTIDDIYEKVDLAADDLPLPGDILPR